MTAEVGSQMSSQEFVAEVEWLVSYGMHPEVIARQLDTTVVAAQRRLYRMGREDLARWFEAIVGQLRRAA